MPKLLTSEQIDRFQRDGFVSPVRVMSAAMRASCGAGSRPSRASRAAARRLASAQIASPLHLARRARAAREDHRCDRGSLRPNLLVWTTNFFIKEKAAPAFVSWHQDSTYWGLDKPDVVTAWIAFTKADETNGAMKVIPARIGATRSRTATPSRSIIC